MLKSILKEFLRYAKLSWRQIYLIFSSPVRDSYREDSIELQKQRTAFFREHDVFWYIVLPCILFDAMFAYMFFWSLTKLAALISLPFSMGVALYVLFCIFVSLYKDFTKKKEETK